LAGDHRYQDAMQAAAESMNEHRRITLAKGGYRRIKPLDAEQWHLQNKICLQQGPGKTFSGPTIVVAEVAPCRRSVPERYSNQL